MTMIFLEYLLTSTGMVINRFIAHYYLTRLIGLKEYITRKATLIGDIPKIRKNINIEILETIYRVTIEGIITKDRLNWNLDYEGIRVLGGFDQLTGAIKDNYHMILLYMDYLNFDERLFILNRCKELSLTVYLIENMKIKPISIIDVCRKLPDKYQLIPEEVLNISINKSVLIIGSESKIYYYLISSLKGVRNIDIDSESDIGFDLNRINNKKYDFIIDLRIAIITEKSFKIDKIVFEMLKNNGEIKKCVHLFKNKPRLITIVPLELEKLKFDIPLEDVYGMFLFSSGIISKELDSHPEYISQYEYWDNSKEISSYILKSLSLWEDKSCQMHCRSINALTTNEMLTMLQFTKNPYKYDLPTKKFLNKKTNSNFNENKYTLIMTKYFGLCKIKKNV